jgi:predicted amidohydrolase
MQLRAARERSTLPRCRMTKDPSMTRIVTVGAAQLGPIARNEPRVSVVARMITLMRQAREHGCDLVAYPELALTTFFPRWHLPSQADIDAFFEREMPSAETAPLFAEARKLGIGFMLGYLPGHADHQPWRSFQHLEKAYFEVGNLGFPVARAFGGIMGMCICNDRRWPETYRVMGLQGVEMILLGYNTPFHNPPAPEHDALSNFHNQLSMQAGAYQNGTWVVGVAKAGNEEGVMHMGQSQIIAPSGETVAMCATLGDELAVARCDLDLTTSYKTTTFNFAVHRQPQAYGLIVERKGAVPPPE